MNLSSSSTAGGRTALWRAINRPNTSVHKRSSIVHMVRTDDPTEGSEKLVSALKEITTTNKEMETRKLDLQVELHSANLEYKRERDTTTAENIRLSLFHQSAVVQAISSLTQALSRLNQPQLTHNSANTVPVAPTTETPLLVLEKHEGSVLFFTQYMQFGVQHVPTFCTSRRKP